MSSIKEPLYILVSCAENVGTPSKCSSYVEILVKKNVLGRSSTVMNDENPFWDFVLDISAAKASKLSIVVYSEREDKHAEKFAKASITRDKFPSAVGVYPIKLDVTQLVKRKDKLSPKIWVTLGVGQEPAARVFGVSIEELMKRQKSALPDLEVPAFFDSVMGALYHVQAWKAEGIGRIAGSVTTKTRAIRRVNSGRKLKLKGMDEHTLCDILKLWLRELPDPLLKWSLLGVWREIVDLEDSDEQARAVSATLLQLSEVHRAVLAKLLDFFSVVLEHERVNRMNQTAVSTVLGPNILRNPTGDVSMTVGTANSITRILLRCHGSRTSQDDDTFHPPAEADESHAEEAPEEGFDVACYDDANEFLFNLFTAYDSTLQLVKDKLHDTLQASPSYAGRDYSLGLGHLAADTVTLLPDGSASMLAAELLPSDDECLMIAFSGPTPRQSTVSAESESHTIPTRAENPPPIRVPRQPYGLVGGKSPDSEEPDTPPARSPPAKEPPAPLPRDTSADSDTGPPTPLPRDTSAETDAGLPKTPCFEHAWYQQGCKDCQALSIAAAAAASSPSDDKKEKRMLPPSAVKDRIRKTSAPRLTSSAHALPPPATSAVPEEVRGWSAQHVQTWLGEIGLDEIKEPFAQHNIDGSKLVSITNEYMKNDMGIFPFGYRRKLQLCLRDLL